MEAILQSAVSSGSSSSPICSMQARVSKARGTSGRVAHGDLRCLHLPSA